MSVENPELNTGGNTALYTHNQPSSISSHPSETQPCGASFAGTKSHPVHLIDSLTSEQRKEVFMKLPQYRCDHCNKPSTFKKCSRCRYIKQYCSRECQIAHWKDRKVMCTVDLS